MIKPLSMNFIKWKILRITNKWFIVLLRWEFLLRMKFRKLKQKCQEEPLNHHWLEKKLPNIWKNNLRSLWKNIQWIDSLTGNNLNTIPSFLLKKPNFIKSTIKTRKKKHNISMNRFLCSSIANNILKLSHRSSWTEYQKYFFLKMWFIKRKSLRKRRKINPILVCAS